MLNLNSVILFSDNPKRLVDFYQKVVGAAPAWTGGDFVGFMVGSGSLIVGPHDKVKGPSVNPERMIINLETADVAGEFSRIKGLGATVVAEPYHPGESPDMWLATLADPDNKFFQLASPMSK